MPLAATVIGAYPEPDCLPTPDWFKSSTPDQQAETVADSFNDFIKQDASGDLESLYQRASKEVITDQENLGIDVVTDGEVRRENYIYHFCRRLEGFDFDKLILKQYRNGATRGSLPSITGPVAPLVEAPWCAEEWSISQRLAPKSVVKMTLPGPMTIMDSSHNAAYEDEEELSLALVECIRKEVEALSATGCRYIQIDEPVLVRKPEKALQYGIDHLAKCFKGVGRETQKIIHLCCGYPNYLDQSDYAKADKEAYQLIADKLDEAGFDAVSLEDAHRKNDLDLFGRFKKTSVILGVVGVARSRVESVEEIRSRVDQVLERLPPSRLILAPDCGLGYLTKDLIRQKLTNMVTVAKSVP